ncbi:MAG TPA: DUF3488 and transglutaminase-like domain-containing protein [Candidatus Limnocylindrales bacterium]|nr:DUF3488 and transglutaminase-like domain-containing protein [Candidatus Limnocylindrales bacterium]
MKLLSYFRLFSYLLIACGFLSLLLTEFFGTSYLILFTILLTTGWMIDSDRIHLRISNRFWNALILPAAFLSIVDILFIRRYPVVGIVSFLIFLQVTKLFQKKENRDYLFLYVISFIQLLTVAVVTTDVIFSIPFILYTVLATWTLIIFHLKQQIEIHQKPQILSIASYALDSERTPHPNIFQMYRFESILNPSFFLGTSMLTLLMFAVTLTIFFVVPRISIGYFFQEKERIQPVSGFSDEVILGSFGNIRKNHTPIMRVELPDISGKPSTLLYWRGISLDFYDGRSWKVSRKQERKVAGRSELTLDGKTTYFFNVGERPRLPFLGGKLKGGSSLLRQEIEVSPITSTVIFGAHQIQGVAGMFTPLNVDELSGTIRSDFPPYRGRKYTVYSDLKVPSEEELKEGPMDYGEVSDLKERYTQLPPLSPEIKKLARSITENSLHPYDKARAIERFLQDNFTYSLEVKREKGVDPLEDFFFKNRAGHCEYFATGMVVLLRTLDIPARIVNGFQQGQWNEFGKYFVVRQSDAHSWVEVFFPGKGWITFDPTPPAAFSEEYAPVIDRIPVVNRVNRYLDFIRTRWDRYIVQYNLMDQVEMAITLRNKTLRLQRQMAKYLEKLPSDLPRLDRIKTLLSRENLITLSVIAIGLTAVGIILFRSKQKAEFKKLFPHSPASPEQLQIARLYVRMLRILAKKGFPKKGPQTPQEFVFQLAEKQVPYTPEVQEITCLYYKARYGGVPITREELQKAVSWLKVISHFKSHSQNRVEIEGSVRVTR